MTLIVNPLHYPSKAVLKQNLEHGVELHEPSIMGSYTKRSTDFPVGFEGTVTNHPLRTRVAQVKKISATSWTVK